MKIVLINPPYSQAIIREGRCQSPQNMRKTSIPQMTLAYLAGILNRDEHAVSVYDSIALNISNDDIFSELESTLPDIAMINSTTPSIQSDLNFVKELKERYPNCYTALFGIHATVLHREILLENSFVDCVIRNEPESAAVELVTKLQKGDVSAGIQGCSIRNGNDVIVKEGKYNPDLDSLGFPAWEYFPLNHYVHPIFNKPYLIVNTSRGCVHKCIFCVGRLYYGNKVRYRSIDSIIDELKNHVIGKFNVRYVWFYADDFTRSVEFVKDLCKAIIKNNIKIKWWSNTRVDKPDLEMFRLMKKAGCYMLSIGGESGNSEILKIIKKGTKPEHIRKTVCLLRKAGINSLVYFLIGLPGETRKTIKETVEFAKEINPDYVEFYPAVPYPGTEFYEMAKMENLITDKSWDKYMCGGNRFVVSIPGIDKDELSFILRKSFRDFYFRWGYFRVLIKRFFNINEFFRLLTFGISYFRRLL